MFEQHSSYGVSCIIHAIIVSGIASDFPSASQLIRDLLHVSILNHLRRFIGRQVRREFSVHTQPGFQNAAKIFEFFWFRTINRLMIHATNQRNFQKNITLSLMILVRYIRDNLKLFSERSIIHIIKVLRSKNLCFHKITLNHHDLLFRDSINRVNHKVYTLIFYIRNDLFNLRIFGTNLSHNVHQIHVIISHLLNRHSNLNNIIAKITVLEILDILQGFFYLSFFSAITIHIFLNDDLRIQLIEHDSLILGNELDISFLIIFHLTKKLELNHGRAIVPNNKFLKSSDSICSLFLDHWHWSSFRVNSVQHSLRVRLRTS